jgi:hypothetical protein
MCIVACVNCAFCIILTCDMYLSDLQVLKIWDFGSTARCGQVWQSQAKPAAWEALRSVPSYVTEGGHEAVYFFKKARMDLFAIVPS